MNGFSKCVCVLKSQGARVSAVAAALCASAMASASGTPSFEIELPVNPVEIAGEFTSKGGTILLAVGGVMLAFGLGWAMFRRVRKTI